MFQAADEVVLQIRHLEMDFGIGNVLFGKWNPVARVAVFVASRLSPPEEFLVISAEQDQIKLRPRFGSMEFDTDVGPATAAGSLIRDVVQDQFGGGELLVLQVSLPAEGLAQCGVRKLAV